MPSLSAIFIYPVKSAAAVSLSEVDLDRFGAAGDRRWMLVDSERRFLSQREDANLARLQAQTLRDGLRLSLDQQTIEVALPAGQRSVQVRVWDDLVPAIDAGDAVARWLSASLQRPARLVYMPDSTHRYVDGHYATGGETVSFADGFPLLLVTESSLQPLNRKLSRPVGMDRFRPNLVVAGCEPYAEDGWQRLRIGAVEFEVAKPCSRCVVPSIDQRSGEKDTEILRALAGYRRGVDRQVYFGQNLLYRQPGTLHVGDRVEILA